MNVLRRRGALLLAAGLLVALDAANRPGVWAQGKGKPLVAENFEQSSPRGFGDRNNSWAQSMVLWKNYVYVGTTRQSLCTSLFAVWSFARINFGQPFADTYLSYPPQNPDLACAPDGADISVQAEIWRTKAGKDDWQRVFQSPLALDNPGTGAPSIPPPVGKKLPYEIGFRGLAPFTEPDGTEALYAFGVNSTVMWDRTKLPPPRILRSTNGTTFTPIPQAPGTFLGDLPFDPDHSSFRSPTAYKGKMFVLAGPIFGQGSLIASADPAKGNDAWFLASPPGQMFYDMEVFNGWLYLGAIDTAGGGYSVVKTRAEGPPPYAFTTVIGSGGYLTNRPSRSVVSMHEYLGRLYVGTATFTEIVRINADDTWDLVIGEPRVAPLAAGGSEWKYPISGLHAGFGHSLNDHAWQMDDPYGYLYIGTYDASTASKTDPVNGPLLAHNMGADLYRTNDGWHYGAVTTNGFASPDDPYGGPFDYGIRTMITTKQGEYLGTANDYYGLMIFRAKTRGSSAPDPPDPLEVEPTTAAAALLSWETPPSTKTFQVWRAEIKPILVRDDANFEAWNGTNGNKIPDFYVGPYSMIASTRDNAYIDASVEAGHHYMYYVVSLKQAGQASEGSNLVTFPLLTPPVTFAQLRYEIQKLEQRGRYKDAGRRLSRAFAQLDAAQALAASCDVDKAANTLNPGKLANDVLDPDALDLQILAAKLVRRLEMFDQFGFNLNSAEFCTHAPPSF